MDFSRIFQDFFRIFPGFSNLFSFFFSPKNLFFFFFFGRRGFFFSKKKKKKKIFPDPCKKSFRKKNVFLDQNAMSLSLLLSPECLRAFVSFADTFFLLFFFFCNSQGSRQSPLLAKMGGDLGSPSFPPVKAVARATPCQCREARRFSPLVWGQLVFMLKKFFSTVDQGHWELYVCAFFLRSKKK